ncbi:hypothetical protein SARC_10511, partial [Sphaeroforma arctica JP610]
QADGIWNIHEVDICRLILKGLSAGGVHLKNIGLISPYKAQVTSLRSMVAEEFGADSEYVEPHPARPPSGTKLAFLFLPRFVVARVDVHTIDKYQGRDKDIILFSMVRSNPDNDVGCAYMS